MLAHHCQALAACRPCIAQWIISSVPVQQRALSTSPYQLQDGSSSSTDEVDSISSSSDRPSGVQGGTDSTSGETSTSSSHARHVSLDDPLLNIYLRHNVHFMTDLDREYKIGQINAFDKKVRLELRKALAAQRLHLRDVAAATAAASSGSRRQQRSLAHQMNSRLADMQDYLARTARR